MLKLILWSTSLTTRSKVRVFGANVEALLISSRTETKRLVFIKKSWGASCGLGGPEES